MITLMNILTLTFLCLLFAFLSLIALLPIVIWQGLINFTDSVNRVHAIRRDLIAADKAWREGWLK